MKCTFRKLLIFSLSLTSVVSVRLALADTSPFVGAFVVHNGAFSNVYVYPRSFPGETWEQHMNRLRSSDGASFSRVNIDRFTSDLMKPVWPSYFDMLYQYGGINPPKFLGSGVASVSCVNKAMRDRHNVRGQLVMQWGTIRSLANCHRAGHDPTPQVNLIFSPDIQLGRPAIFEPDSTSGICGSGVSAYHWSGFQTPDYTVMSTNTGCVSSFTAFGRVLTHEIVETLTNPGGAGVTNFGADEVADKCNQTTVWNGRTFTRYWSDFDQNCQPRFDPPGGSTNATWVLGTGSPLFEFRGGQRRTRNFSVPMASRGSNNALVSRLMLVTKTGGDNLDGGHAVDAVLHLASGDTRRTSNINARREWNNGQTHAVRLSVPSGTRVNDIASVDLITNFPGGIAGKNWKLDKLALVVSFNPATATSPITRPTQPVTTLLLDRSGTPLMRLTGHTHDLNLRAKDPGVLAHRRVARLNLVIDTGGDNLRGGDDNVDILLLRNRGGTIRVNNANRGREWKNWSTHTVRIPLPVGRLELGDISGIRLHTNFHGDNWNVQRVRLKATLR